MNRTCGALWITFEVARVGIDARKAGRARIAIKILYRNAARKRWEDTAHSFIKVRRTCFADRPTNVKEINLLVVSCYTILPAATLAQGKQIPIQHASLVVCSLIDAL